MVAVSDTSVISNLAIIQRLELLHSQFENVFIPAAVRDELSRLANPDATRAIQKALRIGWLRVRLIANSQLAGVLCNDLDLGEAEAIALAVDVPADILLIDEKEGRARARQAGLKITGILGILLRAKSLGGIASVKAEIDALRARAAFFIAGPLENEVLRAAGE
jgi:hypothetical protein